MHRYGRVAYNIEAAAASRSVESEARDDDVASGRNSAEHLSDILLPVFGLRQKMKHRPVMPDVVSCFGKLRVEYVGGHPMHAIGSFTQTLSRDCERRRSNVENRHVAIAGVEKPVNQSGCATADVDYWTVESGRHFLDEMKRDVRFGLIPADLCWIAGVVHFFPVTLVHRQVEFCSSKDKWAFHGVSKGITLH